MADQPIDTTDQQAVRVAQEKLPTRCDGKEQYAFEAWAAAQRYDMNEHPLHYLFLNERTAAARDGWAAGLKYASDIAARLASVSSASAEGREATVEDHNAAFDPADEAGGDAFRAGFREGWIFGQSPDGTDYDELTEQYGCAVDIEPSEAWHGYRDEFFARLPLAAIPEVGSMLAASPEPVPATNQAGEVERNLEAQRQTIEACACLVDRHPMRMDDNARMTLADTIRCLTPDESLAGDTLDAKTADYNGHKPNRYLPEIPPGASLFAVNPSTGAWHYVNHAGTWQGMPNPLATQPATSQEGEAMALIRDMAEYAPHVMPAQHGKTVCDDYSRAAILAATPTPPTLSEDLREALQALERQAVALYRAATPAGNYGANAEGSDANQNAFADKDPAVIKASAALAQVKAS